VPGAAALPAPQLLCKAATLGCTVHRPSQSLTAYDAHRSPSLHRTHAVLYCGRLGKLPDRVAPVCLPCVPPPVCFPDAGAPVCFPYGVAPVCLPCVPPPLCASLTRVPLCACPCLPAARSCVRYLMRTAASQSARHASSSSGW